MKVLVLGQGGREHALVHRLAHSPSVNEVHAVPGNDGMRQHALCHDWDWKEVEKTIDFCLRTEIELVIFGPEDPLVAGIADRFRERGLLVVGPGREGAQLEGSKIFSKEFMIDAKIPTAKFETVNSVDQCLGKANQFTPPYVLKADGLAVGKDVTINKTIGELKASAQDLFEKKIFGEAGSRALLEQFSPGWELSYLVLTNGSDFQALPIAQDHKRLKNNDEGPNTGGMGTVAPLKIDAILRTRIENEIVKPTIQTLQNKGIVYRGFIFFGVMVTESGPQLLEYNCRLGDPETQVLLPLIQNDFGLLMKDLAMGKLQELQFRPLHSACVVLAAPGYPASPEKGVVIQGDPLWSTDSSYFLVAGAKRTPDATWVTNGGRVLCSVGCGSNRQEALDKAYAQAGQVRWPGLLKRDDIGKKSPVSPE